MSSDNTLSSSPGWDERFYLISSLLVLTVHKLLVVGVLKQKKNFELAESLKPHTLLLTISSPNFPFPSLVCPLDSGGVVDEHALMFGGVEFGDEPWPAPEQLPFEFAVLWYIIESPWRESWSKVETKSPPWSLKAPTIAQINYQHQAKRAAEKSFNFLCPQRIDKFLIFSLNATEAPLAGEFAFSIIQIVSKPNKP
jgi:hypothetical protein